MENTKKSNININYYSSVYARVLINQNKFDGLRKSSCSSNRKKLNKMRKINMNNSYSIDCGSISRYSNPNRTIKKDKIPVIIYSLNDVFYKKENNLNIFDRKKWRSYSFLRNSSHLFSIKKESIVSILSGDYSGINSDRRVSLNIDNVKKTRSDDLIINLSLSFQNYAKNSKKFSC